MTTQRRPTHRQRGRLSIEAGITRNTHQTTGATVTFHIVEVHLTTPATFPARTRFSLQIIKPSQTQFRFKRQPCPIRSDPCRMPPRTIIISTEFVANPIPFITIFNTFRIARNIVTTGEHRDEPRRFPPPTTTMHHIQTTRPPTHNRRLLFRHLAIPLLRPGGEHPIRHKIHIRTIFTRRNQAEHRSPTRIFLVAVHRQIAQYPSFYIIFIQIRGIIRRTRICIIRQLCRTHKKHSRTINARISVVRRLRTMRIWFRHTRTHIPRFQRFTLHITISPLRRRHLNRTRIPHHPTTFHPTHRILPHIQLTNQFRPFPTREKDTRPITRDRMPRIPVKYWFVFVSRRSHIVVAFKPPSRRRHIHQMQHATRPLVHMLTPGRRTLDQARLLLKDHTAEIARRSLSLRPQGSSFLGKGFDFLFRRYIGDDLVGAIFAYQRHTD